MSRRIESANSENIYRSLSQSSACTWMAWVKIVSLPGAGAYGIVGQIHGSDSAGSQLRILETGILRLFTDGVGVSNDGSTALSTGVWYHVAVSCPTSTGASNQTWKAYLNAVQEVTRTDYVSATMNEIRHGHDYSAGAHPADMLIGYTRLFGTEMSASDIATEKASATAVAASPTYDDDLISTIGGWSQEGTVSDSDDEPSFGSGHIKQTSSAYHLAQILGA